MKKMTRAQLEALRAEGADIRIAPKPKPPEPKKAPDAVLAAISQLAEQQQTMSDYLERLRTPVRARVRVIRKGDNGLMVGADVALEYKDVH